MSTTLESYRPPARFNPYKAAIRVLWVLGYVLSGGIPAAMHFYGLPPANDLWILGTLSIVIFIVWNVGLIIWGICWLNDKNENWEQAQAYKNRVQDD